MRFMMLMIPKGYEKAPADFQPPADGFAAMMKYNQALKDAGVLLSLDGLHPPAKGARVAFSGGQAKVTQGPFADAREALGGFWMIDVKSRDEAIEWAKRCPVTHDAVIEIRQVQEMADFSPEIQKRAAAFGEPRKRA